MAIDFSTIWIKWGEIDEPEKGGTLLGYRIHVKKEEHHENSQPFYKEMTVGPNITEATITGLPTWTSFRVWVAAFTAAGEGEQKNDEWIRTSKQ